MFRDRWLWGKARERAREREEEESKGYRQGIVSEINRDIRTVSTSEGLSLGNGFARGKKTQFVGVNKSYEPRRKS